MSDKQHVLGHIKGHRVIRSHTPTLINDVKRRILMTRLDFIGQQHSHLQKIVNMMTDAVRAGDLSGIVPALEHFGECLQTEMELIEECRCSCIE